MQSPIALILQILKRTKDRMAFMHHIENDTVAATIGGTILSIIPHLATSDITRTVVLGALGAVVSFVFTQFSKWIWKRIKAKFQKSSNEEQEH